MQGLASVTDQLTSAGHQAIGVRCDVADEAQAAAAVDLAVTTYGRLDMAFNNAGIQVPPSDAADEPAENFDRVTAVNLRGVWTSSALQLDEAERAHLFDLARAAQAGPTRQRRSKTGGVTPGMRQILDAITDTPAWIRNARHDMLAANQLARALYAPVLADPRRPANNARFVYLDPASKEFFVDWERAADDIAAMLRSEAGRNPYDKQLIELIGELSTRSDDFRTRWASHNVRFHRTGHKIVHHPVVGRLEMNFEAMEFPAHPGLTLLVYTAPANTPTADAIKMLASWAATAPSESDLDAHASPES